jgi:large subunit ribosomal protein L23
MELALTDIILGPVLSDKAYKLNQEKNVLVLKVHPKANKPMVKEAIEKLFNAKVDDIRIMNRKGKTRRVGRFTTNGKLEKRAIVKLKEGYSLNLGDQPVSGDSETAPENKD